MECAVPKSNKDNDKTAGERASAHTEDVRKKEQLKEESSSETVSKPGGFANDPDEPTNPNEVRERTLKKLRP